MILVADVAHVNLAELRVELRRLDQRPMAYRYEQDAHRGGVPLMVLAAYGGRIRGKTMLQKVCYFADVVANCF